MKLEAGKWYDVDGSRWQFVKSMRCSDNSINHMGYGGRPKHDPNGKTMYFFEVKTGPGRARFATSDISKARLSREQHA